MEFTLLTDGGSFRHSMCDGLFNTLGAVGIFFFFSITLGENVSSLVEVTFSCAILSAPCCNILDNSQTSSLNSVLVEKNVDFFE